MRPPDWLFYLAEELGAHEGPQTRMPGEIGKGAVCPPGERRRLTVLSGGFVTQGSKVLIEGFQWDAHSIMPALPGKQQLGIAS